MNEPHMGNCCNGTSLSNHCGREAAPLLPVSRYYRLQLFTLWLR